MLVVVDGVYSMEGDLCDVASVSELCRAHGARLMVDEAHGVGALGPTGTGACELFGVQDDVDLQDGHLLEVARELRRVHRRVGRGDRLSADLVAGVPVHRLGRAGGGRGRARSGPDLPLVRGPRAVRADARQRRAISMRGLRELGYRVVEPTPLPGGGETITPIVPVVIGDDCHDGPALEGAVGRGPLHERRAPPRGPARRLADPHERDGDPRARAPGPGARDLRAGQGPPPELDGELWRPSAAWKSGHRGHRDPRVARIREFGYLKRLSIVGQACHKLKKERS